MRYIIRDREAGNEIEWCSSIEEAKNIIAKWEEEDIREGIFKPDFYEIFERSSKMMWHSFTKDFCCKYWESKSKKGDKDENIN